jgi:tRNA nucleotidyltransferase/poly(A) polymerase
MQRQRPSYYQSQLQVPQYRLKTPSNPYDVKPLCSVIADEGLNNKPIKIMLPSSIQSLMQHTNQKGFYIFIKGGRPRRLIRLQQVAILIKTKKEHLNQVSVPKKEILQKELDLHQEELNILQQELKKCDWDLVTNAPREHIEEYLGRPANQHQQNVFLRYHHIGDEKYDVDISYNKSFSVLTDLIETADFYSRAIYMDAEGHFYDITGKGVSDIWNAELHSPFLPNVLFNRYSISVFSLIETLVKYHYENPALDLDQSIEKGMCGFFQEGDNLSNYFYFLKSEDAGHYCGRLASLLNLKYLDISLKVLCKTGLLGYLFPEMSMDLQDEENCAWLHGALTDRLEFINQQIGYQMYHLFEIFISASLQLSSADIFMDEKGNMKPHCDKSLKERVTALIKDNRILSICYENRGALVIPYYQRIFELALTRHTFHVQHNLPIQDMYQANPNYCVDQQATASNDTICENVKRMQDDANGFDVLGPMVSSSITRLELELVALPAQAVQLVPAAQPLQQAKNSIFFKNKSTNQSSNNRTYSRPDNRRKGGK